MDQERFDQLTKTLGSGKSRRGFLKGLTGTALGGVLAAVGLGAAAAPPAGKPTKCYGDHSSCTNGKQCCSGTCTNRTCAPIVVDPCAGKNCDDGNECTADSCSGGICSHTSTPGASCGGGKGICDEFGNCKPNNACGPFMICPPSPVECYANLCDVRTNICNLEISPGMPCGSGAGICNEVGTCIEPVDLCANITCPPTGNECTGTYCDQGQCFTKPKGSGVMCTNGTCDGMGNCLPA